MEIRQRRYFLKIAELGSFSRASQALHIAQPALSYQIGQLEGELGHLLLHRRHNGLPESTLSPNFHLSRFSEPILRPRDNDASQDDQHQSKQSLRRQPLAK